MNTYYNVGRILSAAGKHYGEGIIKKYSSNLIGEVNKKYNETNLKRMRQFYQKVKKELGQGFTFIENEYKIKIGNRYNYINLLLFNYEYNCFIVVELKITELKKEYIGQIQVYMHYIDDNLKRINQDKTIGIIICKKDNQYVMEYCSDDRILAKEYELV